LFKSGVKGTYILYMEHLNIIKSGIVDAAYNDFWGDINDIGQLPSPKAILVLSLEYASGSEEEIVLKKILGACKLQESDYDIIQLSETGKLLWSKIQALSQATTVLLIGVHPQQLGISALFGLHSLNHYSNCTFIPILWLPLLEQQQELKKQLWQNTLKPYFVEAKP